MWEEPYCFGDAFCVSAWDVYAVASVVVRGRSEVPSIYTVGGGAGAAVVGCLVYYESHAWRCNWCAVEIKSTVWLGFCQQYWVDTGRAEKVECQGGMWDEAVPEMQWEVWVAAAQASDEVIRLCLDLLLWGVGAMQVWGHELKLDTCLA